MTTPEVKFTSTGMPAYPAPATPAEQITYLQQVSLANFVESKHIDQLAFVFLYGKLGEIQRNLVPSIAT